MERIRAKDLKLGKMPAIKEEHPVRLRAILKALAPPDSFNVYQALGFKFPAQMWGNDVYGDCAMVAQANFETVLQYWQQKTVIPITTGVVENQYFREQGATWCHPHPDHGLVLVNLLNWWRDKGWKVGKNTYKIYAHTAFNWQDDLEFQSAIYYLYGAMLGIALPVTAQSQWDSQQPWDVVPDDGSGKGNPGSWGYHGVYAPAFNGQYYYCDTWGEVQKMTPAFVKKYLDEAHAVVPLPDAWVQSDPVNRDTLNTILQEIASGGG